MSDEPGDTAGLRPVTSMTLLDRARANDPAAWERLLALYRPLVRFWCAREGLAPEDGEDVTQEVFAAAAGNLAHFRRDRPGDTFRGWLRVITRNAILQHARRQRGPRAEGGSEALERLCDMTAPEAGEKEGEAAEVERLYGRALDLVRDVFEEKTWQAFFLSVIEGRAPAALAAELGMTPANIRQARSRVLRRLKQELGELSE